MIVLLRSAQPAEAAALSALALRSKAHWGYAADFLAACEAELTWSPADLQGYVSQVVLEDQRIAGFGLYVPHSQQTVELDALFIEPWAIGRGYGRMLFNALAALAHAAGYTYMYMQSDPYAAPFYQRMGAIATGTRPSHSVEGRVLPVWTYMLAEHAID